MSDPAVGDMRLPRVTTFGSVPQVNTGGDFYRRASPFMRRINALLDRAILILVAVAMGFIAWLAFGAELEDAYVSDGVRSCRVEPLSDAEVAQVQNQDVNATSAGSSAK